MGVFLGCSGSIEMRRASVDDGFEAEIFPSDINPAPNRFSFDFPVGQFLTGDLLEFHNLDKDRTLEFVDGWPYSDGSFFAHVDEVGGIKLYRKFDDAMSGEVAGRVKLANMASPLKVEVRVRNNIDRIVGQVQNFEINTSRDAVDVTEIGETFRQQYSSLITGSGSLTCLFDYERRQCDRMTNLQSAGTVEMPIYLNQLILRSKMGSEFSAKLTLVGRGFKPSGGTADYDDEVYYELNGVVTNVGMQFEPGAPIRSQIQFVTTGEIRLHVRAVSNYLIQEQGLAERIRQEEYQSGFLELEEAQEE